MAVHFPLANSFLNNYNYFIMNEKILFFDIDGTLLGRNEYLPESAVEAIRKTRAKGNLCFICSGRSKAMLPKKLLNVGFDGIICGGGTYISFKDEVLVDHRLSPTELNRLLDWFDGSDLGLFFEGNEYIHVLPLERYSDPTRLKVLLKELSAPLKEIRRDNLDELSVGKFSGMISPLQWDYAMKMADDIKDFMTVIIHRKPNEANFEASNTPLDTNAKDKKVSWSGYGFVEFLPNGFNKATAIKAVLGHLNLPLASAYGFGDSENDREMLTWLPNSVCMGNGDENIKKIASYVAPPLLEDGIYKAMEHFGLI